MSGGPPQAAQQPLVEHGKIARDGPNLLQSLGRSFANLDDEAAHSPTAEGNTNQRSHPDLLGEHVGHRIGEAAIECEAGDIRNDASDPDRQRSLAAAASSSARSVDSQRNSGRSLPKCP